MALSVNSFPVYIKVEQVEDPINVRTNNRAIDDECNCGNHDCNSDMLCSLSKDLDLSSCTKENYDYTNSSEDERIIDLKFEPTSDLEEEFCGNNEIKTETDKCCSFEGDHIENNCEIKTEALEENCCDDDAEIKTEFYEGTTTELKTGDTRFDGTTTIKIEDRESHLVTRIHYDRKPVECKECGKTLSGRDSLRQHMALHTGLKPHVCNVCGKSFSVKKQLTKHIRTHTGEQPYSCTVCHRAFSDRSCCIRHMRRAHCRDFDYFLCTRCLTVIETKEEFSAHKAEHDLQDKNKIFYCQYCTKCFSHKSMLVAHEKIHTQVKEFDCSVCFKSFLTKDRLNKHLRTHMTVKPFQCNLCDKNFASKRQLDDHLRLHSGDKPFICTTCGKAFVRKSHLDNHMPVHSHFKKKYKDFGKILKFPTTEVKRRYHCTICGQNFSKRNVLVLHLTLHNETYDYKCTVCDRTFSHEQYLKKHLLRHNKMNGVKCLDCGKIKWTKAEMKEHLRTHIGELPFQCDLCGKFFAYDWSKRVHERKCMERQLPTL